MKAWLSYCTLDDNNNSKLSITELRILLWIYEDEEPDYFRVTQVQQEIDPNKSGVIPRSTWMQYLCSEDAILKRVLYDSVLKKTFEKFDVQQKGFLPHTCVPDLLRAYFKEQLRTLKDIRSVESVYQILDSVTEDILAQINQLEVTEFTWVQFHTFLVHCTQKYPSLSQLIDN